MRYRISVTPKIERDFIELGIINISYLFVRFKVTHILSQAGDKWEGRRGTVSDELLKELIGEYSPEGCIFTCGPKGFMLSARKYVAFFTYFL